MIATVETMSQWDGNAILLSTWLLTLKNLDCYHLSRVKDIVRSSKYLISGTVSLATQLNQTFPCSGGDREVLTCSLAFASTTWCHLHAPSPPSGPCCLLLSSSMNPRHKHFHEHTWPPGISWFILGPCEASTPFESKSFLASVCAPDTECGQASPQVSSL